MGDDGVEVAIGVENDTVGTGAAASVDVEAVQNGELVPGGRGREVEALVVVVLVGVGVLLLAGRVQAVSLVQGSVDIRLPVAGATASVNTSVGTLLDSGSRDADSEADNGGDDLGADHFEGWESLEERRLKGRAGLIARGW